MADDSTAVRCRGCGVVVDEGVVAHGGRWHGECLARATIEQALGVTEDRAPLRPAQRAPITARRAVHGGDLRPEHVLQRFLIAVGITVAVGAAYIILDIGGGPERMADRFFIAVGAIVILAGIDSQYGRLVSRLAPLSLGVSPRERRYAIRSLLLLLGVAALLATLAYRPDLLGAAIGGGSGR